MYEIPSPSEMHEQLIHVMRGINAQVFEQLGNVVMYGPFKGMKLKLNPAWEDGNGSAKLLGSYEVELQEPIAKVMSERKPRTVINIGCAEGYYAVGLAMMIVDARVFAMDVDPDCLNDCMWAAKENGVYQRMRFVKGCEGPEELDVEAPLDRRLYLMDCEGHELELLDKNACPALIKSDIIVECHEFMRPGVTQTLAERFGDTHDITLILPMMPPFERYPFLADAPSVVNILAVAEKRPMPTRWLACWARREECT